MISMTNIFSNTF